MFVQTCVGIHPVLVEILSSKERRKEEGNAEEKEQLEGKEMKESQSKHNDSVARMVMKEANADSGRNV